MLIVGQIIAALGSAIVFAHWVGPDYLLRILPSLIPAISILLAAVFVRLNRGLPAVDWKTLTPGERSRVTTELVSISYEYAGVLALGAGALIMIVAVGGIEQKALLSWQKSQQLGLSAFVGFVMGLLLARMSYVVWRDLDIVRLQKQVIDKLMSYEAREAEKAAAATAKAAAQKRERELAADKAAAIERASLRSAPTKVTPF